MTKLFDVSAEEAIYIDNSESILLKISNEFSEVNIYFPKDNIQEFKDFITEKNTIHKARVYSWIFSHVETKKL